MSFVRIRPGYRYAFLILALLGLLVGARLSSSAPATRVPNSQTTVITVKWTVTGLKLRDMEEHVTSPYEHALSSFVDQAQGVESHTFDGLVIVKIFLRPGADLDQAYGQIAAASEYLRRQYQLAMQPLPDAT